MDIADTEFGIWDLRNWGFGMWICRGIPRHGMEQGIGGLGYQELGTLGIKYHGAGLAPFYLSPLVPEIAGG